MRVISIRDLELTIHDDVAYTREQLVEAYWSLHPRYRFFKSVPVNSKFLDVGAGPGGLQFWREWGKPPRLDIAMYAVDIVKGEHFDCYAAYQICNIERDNLCLPVPTFDAIHVSHVLERTTDKSLVLRKLAEALSLGGRLYVEIPTPETRNYPPREEFLKNGIQISTLNFFDDPTHIDTLSPDELRELVCGIGLHIVEQGTIQNPFLEDQLIAYGVGRGDVEVTTYGVWSKLRWAYYVVAQNIYARKATVYSKNYYPSSSPSPVDEGLDTSMNDLSSAQDSCKKIAHCMSYVNKVQQEIAHYKEIKNVHELPSIFHYWSHNYLRPKLEALGFDSINDFYVKHIIQITKKYPRSNCEILSVGSGNCDTEITLAKFLLENNISNFTFTCLDINPHMLERGKKLASDSQVLPHFIFLVTDVNNWNINKQYRIIIANHSLHHFLELEVLFDKIYRSLDDKGFFLTSDMIGRNGHMRWPEALEIVLALWSILEDRHKWNHQLNRFEAVYEDWDCSVEGFEGIRAQDILPLLLKKFRFHRFLGFANLISIFIDRSFGHNFDIKNTHDCCFIDFVAKLDDYYIELGKIKPTQMIASMTKDQVAPVQVYKHLTPDFCVRLPDQSRPLSISEGLDTSKNDLVLETVSSLGDFLHSSFTRDWPSRRHQESEAAILRLATGERLTANCALCGRESRFSLPPDFPSTDVKTANWREALVCECCGLNNRIRFAFGVMRDICKAPAHSKIYITEQATPTYAWLKRHYPNACGSEFVSSSHEQRVALENYIRELTHSSTEILKVEDLTNLSFSDSCFEFILSFDVLEHIPDYLKAVEQCYRCIQPDGYMLLSVPFLMKDESTLVRAKVAANGAVEHLMEPEYHGDPTQSSGCLCYYHFGWDLIDAMKATGFRDVTILLGWSLENAHWGDVNLIIARK